jgi:hypothetical protein
MLGFKTADLYGSFITYLPENNEQIPQDSALAGNNCMRSLIFEYAIIRQNAKR